MMEFQSFLNSFKIGLMAIGYQPLLKTGSLNNAMPLYHAQEKASIKLSSACSCKAKSARYSNIS